jgi:hypothetical protein
MLDLEGKFEMKLVGDKEKEVPASVPDKYQMLIEHAEKVLGNRIKRTEFQSDCLAILIAGFDAAEGLMRKHMKAHHPHASMDAKVALEPVATEG